ncbi:MAG: hypothetical protein HY532_07490 [Chloroflexi bacterium]|nr:hypothetical protein [Chloroflexota bacterium]
MMVEYFSNRFPVKPRPPLNPHDYLPAEARAGLLNLLFNIVTRYDANSINYHFESNVYSNIYDFCFSIHEITLNHRFSSNFRSWAIPKLQQNIEMIVEMCAWYTFFDITEIIYQVLDLSDMSRRKASVAFEELFNDLLIESGLQWAMWGGKMERRRPEPTATQIEQALEILKDERFIGPHNQLLKAIKALDTRPEPDIENCVKDSVGALEGVARTLIPNRDSLRDALNTEPFKTGIHPILRDIILKIEAYRGDAPGAGHALIDGKQKVQLADAEFVLTSSIAAMLLLVAKADQTTLKAP